MKYELHPLGDSAVIINLDDKITEETHILVRNISIFLEEQPLPGMVEFVPAFTSVTVFYDPLNVLHESKAQKTKSPYELICHTIEQAMTRIGAENEGETRTVEIPVCYGGEFGPDLEYVAKYNSLTKEEVIDIHTETDYLVYMIGFAPGFPYLGGMSEKIAAPRKESPRLKIPEGSVGIAGSQTGIYPIETPGGWQLIGQTPRKLFDIEQDPPTLLRAGDKIRFHPISSEEFEKLKGEQG
ncbi:5-oxoprolinase subunit PxpB [Bacillus sp. Marseille-Q3570]|uniref:5-oxoprolinase subunit PxpB n=1 Tax=Bacillus sp. Marseille-Q3570 TaxID=2963522 RepID=UPI0021B7466E|nr:5-oxoprolinase subunit PxpB [Bacillus sp. Marseille-Q3570]